MAKLWTIAYDQEAAGENVGGGSAESVLVVNAQSVDVRRVLIDGFSVGFKGVITPIADDDEPIKVYWRRSSAALGPEVSPVAVLRDDSGEALNGDPCEAAATTATGGTTLGIYCPVYVHPLATYEKEFPHRAPLVGGYRGTAGSLALCIDNPTGNPAVHVMASAWGRVKDR